MLAESVLSPKSVYHAQFEELGVIDGRRLHPAAWGRVRGVAGRWVNRVGRPHRCTASSSAGFVYPSAPLSRWIFSRSLSAQTQEGMPAATRQQVDEEERAATAVALGEAQGQAEQAVAAEQAAKDALELERVAREEAEKAGEALEVRLAAQCRHRSCCGLCIGL